MEEEELLAPAYIGFEAVIVSFALEVNKMNFSLDKKSTRVSSAYVSKQQRILQWYNLNFLDCGPQLLVPSTCLYSKTEFLHLGLKVPVFWSKNSFLLRKERRKDMED